MERYRITAKGRLALTALIGAVCLVVMFVTAGSAWLRAQSAADPTPDQSLLEQNGSSGAPVGSGDGGTDTAPSDVPVSDNSVRETEDPPEETESPEESPIPVETPPHTSYAPLPSPSPDGGAAVPKASYVLLFAKGDASLDAEHQAAIREFIRLGESAGNLAAVCEGNAYDEDGSLALERARNASAYVKDAGFIGTVLPVSTSAAPGAGESADDYHFVRLYWIENASK